MSGGNFFRAAPILAMCIGHSSGQFVYPKNSSVTDPSVLFQKSNGAPDVSVRTNLGLCSGGVTRPPRYVSLYVARAHMAHERPSSTPTRRDLMWDLLSANNDPAGHAELIMNGTDVVERALRRERHAKARDPWSQLRQAHPILGRRRQESRIDAFRKRADDGMSSPVRGCHHICRRRPGIIRLETKRDGMVYGRVETRPLNRVPHLHDNRLVLEAHE